MNWFERLLPKEPTQPEPQITPIGKSIDIGSETWGFVHTWATSEIARLRESNDSALFDATKTAHTRGRIKALKDLIALPDKKTRERKPASEDY